MILADSPLPQPTLREQIEAAQAAVRSQPEQADNRARLFQWLVVAGDWERARAQLDLWGRLSPQNAPTVALYRSAIDGELQRQAVFAGQHAPHWFGASPAPGWLAAAHQALLPDADIDACAEQIREQAHAARGRLTVQATAQQPGGPNDFDWIGDGDSRLAPVCEIHASGRYGWLPYADIRRIRMDAPQGLCDLVWVQALIELADGRQQACLIPARYPAAGPLPGYAGQDDAALMGRRTAWTPAGQHSYLGIGQKMLMTDQGEYALLDVREIVCDAPPPTPAS